MICARKSNTLEHAILSAFGGTWGLPAVLSLKFNLINLSCDCTKSTLRVGFGPAIFQP